MESKNITIITNFLNSIKDMFPHIYNLDGTHYYLGLMICRKCTENEIEAYQNMMAEYAHLNSLSYNLESSDCKSIANYYSQIISAHVEPYNEILYGSIMRKQNDLISELSNEIVLDLIDQYNKYQKIMRWHREAIY